MCHKQESNLPELTDKIKKLETKLALHMILERIDRIENTVAYLESLYEADEDEDDDEDESDDHNEADEDDDEDDNEDDDEDDCEEDESGCGCD